MYTPGSPSLYRTEGDTGTTRVCVRGTRDMMVTLSVKHPVGEPLGGSIPYEVYLSRYVRGESWHVEQDVGEHDPVTC